MKLRLNIDRLLILGGLLLLVIMWGNTFVAERKEASRNPTTAADSASGVSVFYLMKDRLENDSAVSFRRAIFKIDDLKGYDTFFLLSPKTPLTSREEKILEEWIEGGGKLVISFHDEDTLKRVQPFIDRSSIKAFIGERPDFEQGVAVKAEAPQVSETTSALFEKDEKYEIYSRLRFQDHHCFVSVAECYVREGTFGKGTVTAFAGLPPFSNGLIGREQNRHLASRLALRTGRAAFDDYHLLVTEKSWSDFATDPLVLLPTLGLLIGVLLFFFFGSGDFDEQALAPGPPKPRRSFHALNRQILRRVVDEPGSLLDASRKHARFLERLLPKEKEKIRKTVSQGAKTPSDREAQALALRLLMLHYNWLKSRGRKS